jgi:hypothetical protein
MLAERLDKAWDARRGSGAIDPVMRFSDEGLVLGAGTVLAKSAASGRDIQVDPSEPRLQALLAAAHGRRPAVGSLAHLRKAAVRWNEGQDAMAAMHLALSRLGRLRRPEADAHRLFLAEGLLKCGVEADAIIAAIETNASDIERLQKFNPDQPRVAAGSGRTSGEWTTTGGGAPSAQGTTDTDVAVRATQNSAAAGGAPGSGAGDHNSNTARLQPAAFDGGAVSAFPVSTPPMHRLTFTTFDGAPNDPAGWSGSFKLDHPTALGGVVIQRIDTVIQQSDGTIPKPPPPYWEVLAYIPPGATSSGLLVDDSWTAPVDGTHGSETTTATAVFYEGPTMSTLPSLFGEGVGEAGGAVATDQDPTSLLPKPSSPPLVRRATLKY